MAKILKHSRELLDVALATGVAKATTYLQRTLKECERDRLDIESEHRVKLQKCLEKFAPFAKEGETLSQTAKRVKAENDQLMLDFMSDILD